MLKTPRELTEKHKFPYKPINGTCSMECPPNFHEVNIYSHFSLNFT